MKREPIAPKVFTINVWVYKAGVCVWLHLMFKGFSELT